MQFYEIIGNVAMAVALALIIVTIFLPSPSKSKLTVVMHAISAVLIFISAWCMGELGKTTAVVLNCTLCVILFILVRDGVWANRFGDPVMVGELILDDSEVQAYEDGESVECESCEECEGCLD